MNEYKFFRKETNEWEMVYPEIWQWEAHYEDGTILKQFDAEGIFHQFAEVAQDKLAVFRMVSPVHKQTYSLVFDPGTMKLIHFYRNSILNASAENETRVRLYCFGYEKKAKGKSSSSRPINTKNGKKLIMAITPTDGLIVTEDVDILTFQ